MFASDLGGLNQVLPVARNLRAMGHEVAIYASGKSVQRLRDLGEVFVEIVGEVDDMFVENLRNNHEVIVVTMNDKENDPSLVVTKMLSDALPVIALQDAYGARLKTTWANTRPRVICVNDPVAAAITETAWPEMAFPYPRIGARIYPTGKPSLDAMYGYDVIAARKRLEEMYNFTRGDRKVVYFAGALDCSGKPVLELVKMLNNLKQNVFLILRHHPRMSEDAPHQIPFWDEARASFKGGTILSNPEKVDPLTVTAGSDVVVSTFSGVLDDAVSLRLPNVAILYKEDAMQHYLRVTGGALTELPLVQLGVTAKAASRKSLKGRLQRMLGGSWNLKDSYRIDGKNTDRVVGVILSA